MRKSRFSEEQIVGVPREQGAGASTAEVCRRHGISEQTFYRWTSTYSEKRRLAARAIARLDASEAVHPRNAECQNPAHPIAKTPD